METERETLKKTADELYDDWKGARLKHILAEIDQLRESWDQGVAHNVMRHLMEARERDIDDLVLSKHKYDKSFSARDVIIFDLEFPDGSDKEEWLAYVKKATMRIEQFRSHALRQNPNPRKERKEGAREDRRPFRSDDEQAWLEAEDKVSKKKKKRSAKKGGGMKEKKHHKKHAGAPKKAQHHRPPMRGGEEITPAPAVSRSRAAPGITPFSRTGSSQPARGGSSRLPAFPEFPGYGRD
jgi:hypothetical protein